MKYLLISLLAIQVQALTLETKTKRNLAQDNLSAERTLLLNIATCSNGSKVEEMLNCVRPFVSEKT